ncbi:hypothetical protein HMPREF9098_1984 [Kingella denitrificans ATCC 33394]|uniref:Uncharacterized protein n=1 Tax=Kingella denitrificans ATCC 33394 TaxID=888741 RepID=F0F1J9_9NEIS|nr:hypothetical protein HMPREF9098_1984 [Kingella denitrificans ATCC 33394]
MPKPIAGCFCKIFFQNTLDNLIFCPILRARMMKNRRSRQGRGRKGRYS